VIAVVVVSLTLLGIAGWLIDSHRRAWWVTQNSASLTERERQFARSMHRRRMMASGTIGAVGAAIGIWPIIQGERGPWVLAIYTGLLLVACSWIMILALIDFAATRQYYRRLRKEQRAKQAELESEIAAMRETSDAERQTA
jgi:fatty acid desaturase